MVFAVSCSSKSDGAASGGGGESPEPGKSQSTSGIEADSKFCKTAQNLIDSSVQDVTSPSPDSIEDTMTEQADDIAKLADEAPPEMADTMKALQESFESVVAVFRAADWDQSKVDSAALSEIKQPTQEQSDQFEQALSSCGIETGASQTPTDGGQ